MSRDRRNDRARISCSVPGNIPSKAGAWAQGMDSSFVIICEISASAPAMPSTPCFRHMYAVKKSEADDTLHSSEIT
jgi:hypothetical protein